MKAIVFVLFFSYVITVGWCTSGTGSTRVYRIAVIVAANRQLLFPNTTTVTDCNRLCTLELRPVCGYSVCRGMSTFPNPCVLRVYNDCNRIKYTLVANLPCEEAFPECFS